MHCIALLGKNISTQHYVIKFNYIFYLQQLHSYPAYMIQNIFKIFGGNFFVFPKQHSNILNCQLSLSKQQLNESSHYCLAHFNSSVRTQLLRCSHQLGVQVSHWCEHFFRKVFDWRTSKLQNFQKKS